jgi:hypothetical protein
MMLEFVGCGCGYMLKAGIFWLQVLLRVVGYAIVKEGGFFAFNGGVVLGLVIWDVSTC